MDKSDILKLVKKYWECEHKQKDNFLPGESVLNYAGRYYGSEELCNLIDASLDFWLTNGKYTDLFETKLKEFLNVKHCLFVNSGSSANLLAFMALTSPLLKENAVKRGDEIITVAAAFPTTVTPIIQFGAVPVFVDVELATANILTSQLENALSEKTKAVFLAHTLGNPFNIAKVKEFCDKHKLWLIEDNCDALGAKYKNDYTGTIGDIGTSSFYPPHHITTGEGGAVYTNNSLLYKIMLSLRDWGRDCWCASGQDNTCRNRFNGQYGKLPKGYDHKYVYSHFGYNLKATEMQAAIGVAQIDKLPFFVKKRRENFSFLYEKLKKYSDIFIFQNEYPDSFASWFGFLIIIKDKKINRNLFVSYLEERKIQTRMLFSGNITLHPCFDNLQEGTDYRISDNLRNTNLIMNNGFWFGLAPHLDEKQLNYIVETIEEYIESVYEN